MQITVTDLFDGVTPETSPVTITVVEGTATTGGGGGVTDHGALTGLADDDHTQYHTDARGDARYWALSTDLATQAELDAHATDTTSVHGIADTSALATDTEVATAVSDHAAAVNPHPTYLTQAEGDAAYDAIGAASSAVSTHEADTTNVHGITDTSALATTASVAELARDAIGTALTAGAGITVTPNDGADTITVASSITQYTDEMARDALGTALVAGSNVTITPNDGADTITIAASSGSAAPSPDDVPGSPNAADYEFEATTSSLPSGWAWGTQNGSTYAESKGGGAVVTPASTGIRAIMQAVPAGTTWTLDAKLRGMARNTAGAGFGLCLHESGTGKYFIQTYDARGCGWAYFSNSTTYGGTEAGYDFYTGAGGTVYFRMEKNSATSYDLQWSTDGRAWVELFAAVNVSAFFTPDKVGFFVQPGGSFKSTVTCEWFRKTA